MKLEETICSNDISAAVSSVDHLSTDATTYDLSSQPNFPSLVNKDPEMSISQQDVNQPQQLLDIPSTAMENLMLIRMRDPPLAV